MLEFGLPSCRLLREVERPHLLVQVLGVEERFGFDRNIQHRTARRSLTQAIEEGRRKEWELQSLDGAERPLNWD
jgi:hypothetical protein